MACGSLLLDHCGVLLSVLVQSVDGGVDLLKPGGLFLSALDDCVDIAVDLLDFRNDRFQCAAGFANQKYAVLDLLVGRIDQSLNLFRSVGRTLSKFTNFLCDDRKTLAGLPCAGGFDTGVQSEKVGLDGNLINPR